MSNVIRLGDYITEISEKTTVNNQHMVLTSSQEGIVSQDDYFNKQVASKDNTGYKIIRRGQFTYRAMSDTGRFYINRLNDYDIGIVSPAYPVFELRTNGQILPEYLQEYFHSEHFQNAITLSSTGSTRVSLKLAKIADLRIDIPTLPKQQRAVQAISHVNHLISMQNSSAAKLDQLVKSRFVEMFGDPMTNPKGYPCYTVGDIIEFQGGSQPDKKYFEYVPSKDNIRLIQIRDYKSDKYITYIPRAMAKRFCTADDIMIGRYGPPIFQILKGIEGSFNVALMKATPKQGNREFIREFLKQDCLLEYLEGLSQRTAGQDGIQMDKLKAYPFPYPPIALQDRFAAFVAEVDKSKLAVKQSLEKLETLKKSLMQKYFG